MRNIASKIIFLSLMFSFGCFQKTESQSERPRYKFGGVVLDSISKEPVDSSVVTIITVTSAYPFIMAMGITDSSGAFLIDSVYPGRYEVSAEREDYLTFIGRVMIEHRDQLAYTIPLLRTSDAPSIVVSPESLSITVRVGEGTHRWFSISNEGDGISLTWNLFEDPPVIWLDANPISGIVSPHHTQSVDLHFHASSYMMPGVTATALIINSNDPCKPCKSIPVKFKVIE